MKKIKWLNLQLFAGDGAGGEGGGEGASTGANNNTVDAGQQRLLELGVPPEKLRKRAKSAPAVASEGAKTPTEPTQQTTKKQDAAADTKTEEKKTENPARMSWDEIMADPEYNKQMQFVVQSRLKTAKNAEENLGKLARAHKVLAKKHNLDPDNMDYDALSEAILNDGYYYEEQALKMGVPVETAKKIEQQQIEQQIQQRAEAQTLEQQKIQQHIQKLEQQGEALKKVFPSFDLRTELQNPAFARMTSPNVGISVEDAYYAVHRNEIQQASMQATAQKTAEKISNAIQSGSRRPDENGISGQAPSVTSFDYSKASRDQREALKRRIREASARGEKLYPGQ